ncbi:hypothetical protein [Dyella solisilvae]|uniref:hypothetical protein n=1 Tax=Dyella solisilvae TaxID=1920168 RepID=UPI0018F6CB29|nr:hypothetical protein [Dyella solisilvae]
MSSRSRRARLEYAEAMFDKVHIRGTVSYLHDGDTIITTHHLARQPGALAISLHRVRPLGKAGHAMRLGAPPSTHVFNNTRYASTTRRPPRPSRPRGRAGASRRALWAALRLLGM